MLGPSPLEASPLHLPVRSAIGELLRGAGGAWVVNLTGLALTLGTSLLLARALGARDYGALVYTLAWAEVLSMMAPLGFDKLLIREVARFRQEGRWLLLRGILQCAARRTLLGVIAAVGSAIGFGVLMGSRLDPALLPAFWLVTVLVPVRAWANLRHGALLGLSRPVAGLMVSAVTYPAVFLLLCSLGVAFWSESKTAVSAAVAAAVAWTVALVVADRQMRSSIDHSRMRNTLPLQLPGEWNREALPMVLIVALTLITLKADIIILGAVRGAREAGIYSMAVSLAYLVRLGLVAINPVLAPVAANAVSHGPDRRLEAIAQAASRLAFLPALLCTALLLLSGRWVLALFSPDFEAGVPAMNILAVGFMLAAAMGPVETILLMKNEQRLAAWIAAGACGINLALNSALIPVWGMEGAAVATATSALVWAVAMNVAIKWKLGVRIGIFSSSGADR